MRITPGGCYSPPLPRCLALRTIAAIVVHLGRGWKWWETWPDPFRILGQTLLRFRGFCMTKPNEPTRSKSQQRVGNFFVDPALLAISTNLGIQLEHPKNPVAFVWKKFGLSRNAGRASNFQSSSQIVGMSFAYVNLCRLEIQYTCVLSPSHVTYVTAKWLESRRARSQRRCIERPEGHRHTKSRRRQRSRRYTFRRSKIPTLGSSAGMNIRKRTLKLTKKEQRGKNTLGKDQPIKMWFQTINIIINILAKMLTYIATYFSPANSGFQKHQKLSATSGLLRLESLAVIPLGSLSQLPLPPDNVLRSSNFQIQFGATSQPVFEVGWWFACWSVLLFVWLSFGIFINCSFLVDPPVWPLPHEMTTAPPHRFRFKVTSEPVLWSKGDRF